MKRILSVCFALGLLISFRTAAVAALDGSSPLLCVPIEVLDCEAYNGCIETTVEDVNIPQFIRVDFDKKTASGTLADGTLRTVGIERMERENGMLVIQGGQEGRGWSATIGEETGKMTLIVSRDRYRFFIFGACTSP